MELFTLGIGNYTETDVQETARALTGWTVIDGEFRETLSRHDGGTKRILGGSGRFGGADVVRILLESQATADRLAWRLCDLFMGEGIVGTPERKALADGLWSNNLDIGWAVSMIIGSRAFFASPNIRTRVLSPVDFIMSPVRAMELIEMPPSTLLLAEWSARLGQDLFNPPNVGGWPGGRTWLSARSLAVAARSRYRVASPHWVRLMSATSATYPPASSRCVARTTTFRPAARQLSGLP